jgi:hypothetical protein
MVANTTIDLLYKAARRILIRSGVVKLRLDPFGARRLS